MSTTTPADQQLVDAPPFRFLELPPEIRLMIYREVFENMELVVEVNQTETALTTEASAYLNLGLLASCKLIRSEAGSVISAGSGRLSVFVRRRHLRPLFHPLLDRIPHILRHGITDIEFRGRSNTFLMPYWYPGRFRHVQVGHWILPSTEISTLNDTAAARYAQEAVLDYWCSSALGARYWLEENRWFSDIRFTLKVWYLNRRVQRPNIGLEFVFSLQTLQPVRAARMEFTKITPRTRWVDDARAYDAVEIEELQLGTDDSGEPIVIDHTTATAIATTATN